MILTVIEQLIIKIKYLKLKLNFEPSVDVHFCLTVTPSALPAMSACDQFFLTPLPHSCGRHLWMTPYWKDKVSNDCKTIFSKNFCFSYFQIKKHGFENSKYLQTIKHQYEFTFTNE